ncbi:MAG: SPFH domain-containing protein, partial [Pseudomonadota bacterium]
DGEFTTDEISYQIRNIIVSRFSTAIAQSGIPVLDMAANTEDLGKLLAAKISPELAEFGIEMPALFIENISLPSAVEAALDKRSSMGIAGDLGRYTQYSAAEAMTEAAKNPGGDGGMGAGLGMGMGMAMAGQMAQNGPWGAQPTPPPPPVDKVWHIAAGGETVGPFSRAEMGQKAQSGQLSRESWVWTAGQDGWQKAEDVVELAQLFTILPPPPPPGA